MNTDKAFKIMESDNKPSVIYKPEALYEVCNNTTNTSVIKDCTWPNLKTILYDALNTSCQNKPPDNKRADNRYGASDPDRFSCDESEHGTCYLTMRQARFF